jgi:hypothetical protein
MAKRRGHEDACSLPEGKAALLAARGGEGLEQLQALRDGTVVRRHDAWIPQHQRLDAHRLWRTEREVDPLAILAGACSAQPHPLSAGQLSVKKLPQRLGRDGGCASEAQQVDARADPFTTVAFLAVVVVRGLEVVSRARRARDELERQHGRASLSRAHRRRLRTTDSSTAERPRRCPPSRSVPPPSGAPGISASRARWGSRRRA